MPISKNKSMNRPLFSVIIITRNREEELQRCVQSILNDTYKNIEIVILDNGSSVSRTRNKEFLASLRMRDSIKIKYIESAPKGFAELRQMATNNSKGEIIMNIDDDCIAVKDAISQTVKRFMSDDKIGIVGGNITNVGFEHNSRFKGRGKIGVNGRYEVVQNIEDAEVFGSANMSIKREAFYRVGGYDLYFFDGLEEADLTLSVRKRGYKVVYEPTVKIAHFNSPCRYRSRYHNPDIRRLYLFLKHFMPRNTKEWFKFFTLEFKLLIEDMGKSVLQLIHKLKEKKVRDNVENKNGNRFLRYLKTGCSISMRLFKIVISRLFIPYLIFRACKIRNLNK